MFPYFATSHSRWADENRKIEMLSSGFEGPIADLRL